jgi:phosphatidylglycerol---prolipoprotein diacylglyceryl transferase
MRPVLFELGPLTVHSWGVVVVTAFAAASYILRHELERQCGRGDAAFPLIVAAAVGGVVGARVYWFFEHVGNASLADSFSGAGFTWYGGVLGGAVAVLAVARRRGVPLDVLYSLAPRARAFRAALGAEAEIRA